MGRSPWTDEELEDAWGGATSYTHVLKILGIARTPARHRWLREDAQRLGLRTDRFRTNRRWTTEDLSEAVSRSSTFAEVHRFLGGSTHGSATDHIKRRCIAEGVDFSHFIGSSWSKGKRFTRTKDVLVNDQSLLNRRRRERLLPALLETGVEYSCSRCGISTWNDEELTLTIDHEDGDWRNNTQSNLRLLCPNCHSQTPTFGNKRRA